jgi:RHS repeat-associated protein
VDQILADAQVTGVGQAGVVSLPLTDAQGSVRDIAQLNAGGTAAVVDHIIYNSFGKVVGGSNPCLFGYTGRPYDGATNLQNNGARWYDAAIGEWLSEDPKGLSAGDTNEYRYCGNSPTNATDPTGLGQWNANVEWDPTVVQAILDRLNPVVGKFWARYHGTLEAAPTRSRLNPGRWIWWGSQLPSCLVPSDEWTPNLRIYVRVPDDWSSLAVAQYILQQIYASSSELNNAFLGFIADNAAAPWMPPDWPEAASKAEKGRIADTLKMALNIADMYYRMLAMTTPSGSVVLGVEEAREGHYLNAVLCMLPIIPVEKIAAVTFQMVGKAAGAVSELTLPAKVLKAFRALPEAEQADVLVAVQSADNASQMVDALAALGTENAEVELKVSSSLFSNFKGATNLANLTTKQIGDLGESIAKACLGENGYTDIVSVQNASGNGIDIAARSTTGKLFFFEVKTTSVGVAGKLTPRQSDMNWFINDVLSQASSGSGRYAKLSEAEQAMAKRLYDEFNANAGNVSGQVIQVDLKNNVLDVSPW